MGHQGIKYEFDAKPWLYDGPGAWHFVSLPVELAKEIRTYLKSEEEGWGRLKVTVKIGETQWKTAIWFSTKLNTYLLPLKAEIRKSEQIEIGRPATINIWV